MSERQYNKEQVAAIFERASETERAALPAAAEGLTLAELQDIGREVGIAPESVALAARSLDQVSQPPSPTFLGLPIAVGQTVEFDRPLSDSDWEGLVADLRTTFQARGTLRQDGSFRQWTNGNLRALVEPTPSGFRLRLQTMNGNARGAMIAGSVVLAGAAATFIAVTVSAGHINAGQLTGIEFMALVGFGMIANGALRVRRWAQRRNAQIEEVTARLANSVSTSGRAALKPGRLPDLP